MFLKQRSSSGLATCISMALPKMYPCPHQRPPPSFLSLHPPPSLLRAQLPEFCSMMNESLREDCSSQMDSLAILARSINHLCLVRDNLSKQKFPPDGCTYRGGELPPRFFDFFAVGTKYRVPGFLATSFKKSVSQRFLALKCESAMPQCRCVTLGLGTLRERRLCGGRCCLTLGGETTRSSAADT
jgi:hypothetical protein